MRLLLLMTMLLVSSVAAAQTIDADKTPSQSTDDVRSAMVAAWEKRMSLSRNVRFVTREVQRNHIYRDGIVGDAISNIGFQSQICLQRMEMSYRFAIDRTITGADRVTGEISETSFDAMARRCLTTVRKKDNPDRVSAHIDAADSAAFSASRLSYWLDGADHARGDCFIRHALTHPACADTSR